MTTPGRTVTCTCAGCPPKGHRILVHAFQDRAWREQRAYEPCPHPPEDCCGCPRPATQEDLLCDECRQRGGISRLDGRRITAILAESAAT
jgi:hypothetical protein